MKLFFQLIIATLLSSCATNVTTLKEDKDKELAPDRGYLLIGIETNRSLERLVISGKDNIFLSNKDLKRGTNFILVDLQVGTYHINNLDLDNRWYLKFENEDLWKFTITSQGINYVGHLELATRGYNFPRLRAELVNRSSEAIEFLEKSYPNILAKRQLTYGGPGEDNFFNLVNQLKGEE